MEIKRVNDIKELNKEFDIVVNCTGLQARHLLPDPSVHPKRGQVTRVRRDTQVPHVYFAQGNMS